MRTPPWPTIDECNANTVLYEDEDVIYRACWYPQMGGYTGRAVIGFPPGVKEPCFDVWVWHDGEFPFDPVTSPNMEPTVLHHCAADQFINFGNFVKQAVEEAWTSQGL